MTFLQSITVTAAPSSVILIRLIVGAVFLTEGIQKFLFPAEVGPGCFAKIGIPSPDVMGPFVGVVEIICGGLILLGLLTRLAAIPLIINMLVAILSTKIPILLGRGFWGFSLRSVSYGGFWGMAHEARTDWSMLLGPSFCLLSGQVRYRSTGSCFREQGAHAVRIRESAGRTRCRDGPAETP